MLLLANIGAPFIPTFYQLRPLAGELGLVATIVAVLICPFFAKRANIACARVTLVGLVFSLLLVVSSGVLSRNAGEPAGMLMIVADPAAIFWKSILLLFVIGIVVMWLSTTGKSMHEGDGPEFFTLLLGATLGMSLMASSANLLLLVIAVELASLPSYVLAGFRKTNMVGSEASLKYVLFGAATSAIMVYGLSMLYGLCGTLQLDEVAFRVTAGGGGLPLMLAAGGLIVGLGFKISAVPLHFWCPDVFEGAGIDVAAFLSVASKGAGLMLLMRVLMTIASAGHFADDSLLTTLAWIIGIMGAVTATVGNTAAFVQKNIKRLLAYSSIAHAGYMLCALSLLVKNNQSPMGPDGISPVVQAILLYLAVYLFMNLGAFTVAGLIWAQTGSESIADYAGMGRRSPLLSACMAMFMFSLVGLPPLAGFAAKLNVMYILGANGGWWWILVAVIGVNTVLSLYYYVRVLRVMYLEEPGQRGAVEPHPLGASLCVACAGMLVLMLIGFNPLWQMTHNYGRMELTPVGQASSLSQP